MKQNTKKTFRFFLNHAGKYRLLTAAIFVFLIIGSVGDMVWPIIFKQFFDTFGSNPIPNDAAVFSLIRTLILLMIVEGITWIGWRVSAYLSNYFQPKVMANIENECFEYMHGHSYNFFNDNFSGALVKKINRLVRGFQSIVDKILWDLSPMTLKITAILGILFYLHPMLAGILFVWVVVFLGANYFFSIYKFKYDVARSKADTKITAALADTITNSINVKLFASLPFERKRFWNVTDDWFKKTKKSWDITAHLDAGQSLFMIFLEFGILYASIYLWRDGVIGLSEFFLIQIYLFEVFHQLWSFGRVIRDLYERLAESEEMIEILGQQHEVRDIKGADDLTVSSGKVEFKKVSFAYTKNDDTVIRGLSFTAKPSEKIGLIGPSGGGKSTFVKLLLRLFDVQNGKILIDGQDISKVTQDSLRRNVSLVPQDPILFHRNLMENIRYGRRDTSDEEVIAASKMARCHEFIDSFPKGYKTLVGERGVKLSGGQRQRVAIARAILSNAPILVLDEATSSLDSESEALIQEALKNLVKNKTTFVIAHRLSTIMQMDRIIVLEDGEIVDDGHHTDLVTKKSGLYKKLWDFQVGGYLQD